MLSDKQYKEIIKRKMKTLKVFLNNPSLSDIEISNILNSIGIKTSSSTVGRDLTNDDLKETISSLSSETDISLASVSPNEVIEYIKKCRQQNLLKGKIQGGINSQQNNNIVRDDEGHFIGNIPKR